MLPLPYNPGNNLSLCIRPSHRPRGARDSGNEPSGHGMHRANNNRERSAIDTRACLRHDGAAVTSSSVRRSTDRHVGFSDRDASRREWLQRLVDIGVRSRHVREGQDRSGVSSMSIRGDLEAAPRAVRAVATLMDARPDDCRHETFDRHADPRMLSRQGGKWTPDAPDHIAAVLFDVSQRPELLVQHFACRADSSSEISLEASPR